MDKWDKLKAFLQGLNKDDYFQEEMWAFNRVLEEMERIEKSE